MFGMGMSCPEGERLLINWCVKAAEEMIRLLELLRTTNNLSHRSYTDVQGCVVAATTILLCGIMERKSSYKDTVDSAISSLSCVVTNTESFRPALDFVRTFQGITDEAYKRCHEKASDDGDPGLKHTISASYDSWLSAFETGGGQLPLHATDAPAHDAASYVEPRSDIWSGSGSGNLDPLHEACTDDIIASRGTQRLGNLADGGWNSVDSLLSSTSPGLISDLITLNDFSFNLGSSNN